MNEIHDLVSKGFTPQRVEWLGSLVDICKDIKYMEYLDEKISHYNGETEAGQTQIKSDMKGYFDDMVEKLYNIHERANNSGSSTDKDKFKEDALEMLECAKKVKSIMMGMSLDSDVAARYRELFR